MASDTAYLPDEELDQTSKVSFVEWISHRLGLLDCLHCDRKNGNMSTPELRELAKQLLKFTLAADVSTTDKLDKILESMHQENLASHRTELHEQLSFTTRRKWDKSTKHDLGMVIGSVQSFQFLGDPHIGSGNGVIYKAFYEQIYNSLPDAHSGSFDTTEAAYSNNSVTRKMEKMKLRDLLEMLIAGESESEDARKEGTSVPEFQRSDQQWNKSNWLKFFDSGLRDIPMPSIVLGKSKATMNYPWQVIDGNQRLSTILKIFDENHEDHVRVTKPWRVNNKLPDWIKQRLSSYTFNVEKIIAEDDQELAMLYERYNASGRPMSQPQLRVAKHHEISALHHLLLALSGGPTLKNRPSVREALGISGAIDERSDRASSLRKIIPGISGKVTPDEKKQLRKVTEKTYDLWCRIVAYSTYRDVRGSGKLEPSAKQAIEAVFGVYRYGNKALPIVDRLDYVVKEVGVAFGDYAFLSLRAKLIKDQKDKDGKPLVEYHIGKSVHGWATQVQCAGFWDLSDEDISLLKRNPDTFQTTWFEFARDHIVNARQNSKSIWGVQGDWQDKVSELLHELKVGRLANENSEERKRMLAIVNQVLEMPEEGRKWAMESWKYPGYTLEQISFLKEHYESMR
jgi:hypothetical protein